MKQALKNLTDKEAWQKVQDELSEENGIAIVMVEGENSTVLTSSNNNSICRTLYASSELSPLCDRFCGRAFTEGLESEGPSFHHCHADLTYATVPVEVAPDRKLVAIVGRVLKSSTDYMLATEKARSGDWKHFSDELLDNVLLASSLKEIESVAHRLQNLDPDERELLAKFSRREKHQIKLVQDISPVIREKNTDEPQTAAQPVEPLTLTPEIPAATEKNIEKKIDLISEMVKKFNTAEESKVQLPTPAPRPRADVARTADELEEMAAWRSLFNSLLELNYHHACVSVLKFVASTYKFGTLAWLEKKDNGLETYLVGGGFKGQQLKINLPVNDPRLLDAISQESALELLEKSGEINAKVISRIFLFPIVVGGEFRSALVIGDEIKDDNKKRSLAKFCRQVSVSLEILRLRDEIGRHAWLTKAIRKFNEGLNKLDSEEFWSFIAQASAELLQAELGSLLLYDEEDESLVARAAVGKDIDILNEIKEDVGKRVAGRVLQKGRPLVVNDVNNTALPPAPPERKYKTRSFLSYPIVIGERKIGVLNMTDKVDGSAYDEYDLELLNAVTPQLAVALDRAKLERKAGKYEQLSITDPLTGLLNRRYLQERLTEEINRSRRHGYPMSFMMIDVDDFKSYNDNFLHTAGDKVLQTLAHCMKDCLRGADVAARYGGEEFSILLPQTSLAEAGIIAERIREKVASTDFPNRQVTVSIGVAAFAPDLRSPEDLISAADKALYQAKHNGRNNVQIYQNLAAARSPSANV